VVWVIAGKTVGKFLLEEKVVEGLVVTSGEPVKPKRSRLPVGCSLRPSTPDSVQFHAKWAADAANRLPVPIAAGKASPYSLESRAINFAATDALMNAGIFRKIRKDHAERDGKIYLIPDSWADQQGLVKPNPTAGWSDSITQPAEEPFCRCWFKYFYNLRDLPESMLTVKGRTTLADIRAKIMAS